MSEKKRAPRNQTIELTEEEAAKYSGRLLTPSGKVTSEEISGKTLLGDIFEVFPLLPDSFADLVIVDPPYNLEREFNSNKFKKMSVSAYTEWLEKIVEPLRRIIKPDGSLYFCGDWYSSTSIHTALDKHFIVRNRITWEREKGRGAKTNWKNNSEDIWFATAGKNYTFNVDAVKLKRKVIAPYTTAEGTPKDWQEFSSGKFRLTHPSNLWTDISVPFWSMPENTDHPTQKPEKLLAKIILASSNPGDMVFDPFLGSGSTSVTAKKLGRNFTGVELDKHYATLAEKRLDLAETDKTIQGYDGEVFWERNTSAQNKKKGKQKEDSFL